MPNKPRVYMDSCCFIELALHAVGESGASREKDMWHLKQLLNASLDGEIEVLTSILSVAECQHANGAVTDDVKSLFRRFLTSGQYLFLIQDSVLVAERARNLLWAHGLRFGGADSIHLASAMELKCDEFLTFDGKFHSRAKELDELALPIRFPRDTQLLPSPYRQQLLDTGAQQQPNPPVAEAESIDATQRQETSIAPEQAASHPEARSTEQQEAQSSAPPVPGGGSGPPEGEAGAEKSEGADEQAKGGQTK